MRALVRRGAWLVAVAPSWLLVAGCTGGAAPAAGLAQDARAQRVLAQVAPTALDLGGAAPTSTECWTPSRHLLDDTDVAPAGTWKVLCRVHYVLDGARRYQDATCIGNFDAVPMLDHCYVWEYYSDEPRFSDGDRLASPPPTPLP